jgi:dTDP-glucose 4,6-dehydratase
MNKYFENKKVVVTGAAGFVGSHLCDQLLEFGADVIGVDNMITGREKNVEHLIGNDSFTFINADVSQSPEKYLADLDQIDLIFHFASPATPRRFKTWPVEIYSVNGFGTHYLLEFIKEKFPEARFVFAGTSEAYGDPLEHPQKETYWGNVNPNGPRSCYDVSKRMGETICGVFHRNFNIDTRIVRIFNTYGPRINPEDGRVIPDFVSQALRGQDLTVFGDGKQTRSFCYVSDLVEVILLYAAADNLTGETINIGNPGEFTVLETAKTIIELIGSNSELVFQPLPQDDPKRRQPDISKAKQLLDWEPKIDFKAGLKLTIDHLKQELL